MIALADQLALAPAAVAGLHRVEMAEANDLLARWEHYLGPCRRPFHQEGFVLVAAGRPVSVAVSASAVAAETAGYERRQLVELARLCSGEPWATRVMLRLWREVLAPTWESWPVDAAIAYSQNARHDGRLYRFDGWTRVTDRAGSSGGGGGWSTSRTGGHVARGTKTLWLWCYDGSS